MLLIRHGVLARVFVLVGLCAAFFAGGGVSAAPSVSNVTQSSQVVGKYEKFEVTFDVDTVATNPYWPYDPSPAANTPEHPNAVPAGVGVSVDGLFLPPGETDWKKAAVQPGFYMQDYEMGSYMRWDHNRAWLYPKGEPGWRIRFAPTAVGRWTYRIRVVDRSGGYTYDSPSCVFDCVPSGNRGFVRVSPTDCRYFETSDGAYLCLHGLELPKILRAQGEYGFTDPNPAKRLDSASGPYDWDTQYSALGKNGLNALRVWWNCTGPFEHCPLFGCAGQGGYYYWNNLELSSAVTYQGQHFSAHLDKDNSDSLWKALSACVDTKPATRYRFSARVKTVAVTGSGEQYGVYLTSWDIGGLSDQPLTVPLHGDNDWTVVSCTFTTAAAAYTQRLKIALMGVTGGDVYVTDVSLREDLGGGAYGPELLWRPKFDVFDNVPQYDAWRADYQVECARKNGIYLKIVLMEKLDSQYCVLQEDGTIGAYSPNNFYAHASHASRTYQQYFWRYIIARYGYATNIHSFEVTNEGDPFNGYHLSQTQAMAKFFKENDPNQHLVSTSNWHSLPRYFLWSNLAFRDIGYADWHRHTGYIPGELNKIELGWEIYPADTNEYHSPPRSLHIYNDPLNPAPREIKYSHDPIPVTPGHTYTLSWWIKGHELVPYVGDRVTASVKLDVRLQKDTRGENVWVPSWDDTRFDEKTTGSYEWKRKTATFQAPVLSGALADPNIDPKDGYYLYVAPTLWEMTGHCWFDDIELRDETTGEIIDLPNGGFDEENLSNDSALLSYDAGAWVGFGSRRTIRKPLMDPNVPIRSVGECPWGNTGENPDLVRDKEGIWYRKFIWGQINPHGVYSWYYWNENIVLNGLTKYVKAFQNFMADIPLSNGHYQDANAVTSNRNLRAWGQKDLTNNRAHLWIDNKPCTWKNIVDGKPIDPVSGTVTVSGFRDGDYKIEWWNTTTGEITSTEDKVCSGGNITLTVTNLSSDIACKIRRVAPNVQLTISVPSDQVIPGQTVTVTVGYQNVGDAQAANVQVKATVPEQMDFMSAQQGGQYNSGDRSVTWTIPNLAAGESGTRTFQARVK